MILIKNNLIKRIENILFFIVIPGVVLLTSILTPLVDREYKLEVAVFTIFYVIIMTFVMLKKLSYDIKNNKLN